MRAEECKYSNESEEDNIINNNKNDKEMENININKNDIN